ncbi:TrfB-related DNA-binding protein [Halomonas sp. 3D7M]|uniref:TrfB-related DNA-binding protein n=1 Tax=Halomonas sp. 3D7M TaxID=2742617 RepID=UPI0018666CE2|nr:TrfB-related DNA-binding protein [Halomonas sp. 3D7M]
MKRLLTNSEFGLAVRKLPRSLKAKNVAIAKAVLVEGQKQSDLVRETGLSRSAIAAIVRKVKDSYIKHAQPPKGWEKIEVCLPAQMIAMVRALEEEARRQHEEEG